jgi:hypothetical protein
MKRYIIEGTSWSGLEVRVAVRKIDIDVVGTVDEKYASPLVFTNKRKAEGFVPKARAIAPTCAFEVVEYKNGDKS